MHGQFLKMAMTLVFIAGGALSLLMATSEDPVWRGCGRIAWLICATMVIGAAAVWSDANGVTPTMEIDRKGGVMTINVPNPAGDIKFLCETIRGKYVGGPCIGVQSSFWYANSVDAQTNAGVTGLGHPERKMIPHHGG